MVSRQSRDSTVHEIKYEVNSGLRCNVTQPNIYRALLPKPVPSLTAKETGLGMGLVTLPCKNNFTT